MITQDTPLLILALADFVCYLVVTLLFIRAANTMFERDSCSWVGSRALGIDYYVWPLVVSRRYVVTFHIAQSLTVVSLLVWPIYLPLACLVSKLRKTG